jgi:XisI protein
MELTAEQQAIRQVFAELTQGERQNNGIESQIVMDDERGHYQLLSVGWNDLERTYSIFVHLDVRQDQIWVQVDNTDYGVADALARFGIPKANIILGFQAPYKRQYSGFGTGDAA